MSIKIDLIWFWFWHNFQFSNIKNLVQRKSLKNNYSRSHIFTYIDKDAWHRSDDIIINIIFQNAFNLRPSSSFFCFYYKNLLVSSQGIFQFPFLLLVYFPLPRSKAAFWTSRTARPHTFQPETSSIQSRECSRTLSMHNHKIPKW